MISFSIRLDKVAGKGEDATPIIETYGDGSGLVATFDGLGGAGATQYRLEADSFSGAWFASRITKAALAALFRMRKRESGTFDPEKTVGEFAEILENILKHAVEQLDKNPSLLRSKLIRRLPTTLSAIYFEPNTTGEMTAWSINAGDSRAYLLGPETGLQQITQDNLVNGGDALQILYGDSRMSNCIHADGNFDLNVHRVSTASPKIFLSASDGCFDYIKFPAHFEYMLVDALLKASDSNTWRQLLAPEFKAIASDDVTLGLIVVGWDDFGILQNAFRERHQYLKEKFVDPIGEMEAKVATAGEAEETIQERQELREKLWAEYRITYEAFLPKPEQVS